MRLKQSTTLAISLPLPTVLLNSENTLLYTVRPNTERIETFLFCVHIYASMCVCACVRVCVHKSACLQIQVLRNGSACVLLVWKSESTLQESILSFHSVAPRDKLVLSHSAASIFLCCTVSLSHLSPFRQESHHRGFPWKELNEYSHYKVYNLKIITPVHLAKNLLE